MIIGLVGLIGSGKGTVGDMLVERGFAQESFANPLKDAAASIFNWDREMLEGITSESRIWREQEDIFWGERLGIPEFTPRLALQLLGTDVLRDHFHQDIWILSMESRIKKAPNGVVITDARFPNEIEIIRRLGGKVVQIKRGPDPEWWNVASKETERMPDLYPDIHASEYSWVGVPPDYIILNDGTIQDLGNRVKDLLEDLPVSNQS